MVAVALFFMGQFALFTYLRPFLETVTRRERLDPLAHPAGHRRGGPRRDYLIGSVLARGLYRTLIAIPLAMAAIAVALIVLGALAAGRGRACSAAGA